MDINAFNALKTYHTAQRELGADKPAIKTGDGGEGEFKPMEAVKEVASTIVKSEQAASAFMTGQADPHSVVEAIASAELAVETAVTLRNRVVEAYQELLRMPV
ncbi:MAG: flagellar hook-basal body complex protein FliE [Pseudomonadota bacterium]